MKKIIICLLLTISLTACNLNNTPNSKVEEFLGKYQSIDNSIIITPSMIINNNNLDEKTNKEITKVIEKQFSNLTYEIKDTKEDGNTATVTTEIEVLNYKSVLNDESLSMADDDYYKKLIDKLNNTTKRITYTIDFTLTKNNKDIWEINKLNPEEENKLLGIY